MQLKVQDAAGHLVGAARQEWCAAGDQMMIWNGSGAVGEAVALSAYSLRVAMDGEDLRSRRIIVLH